MLINAYATTSRRDDPSFAPTRARGLLRPDGSEDPELAEHLAGFRGFVVQEAGDVDAHTWSLLSHLNDTQWHYTFEAPRYPDPELSRWAHRTNAILFLEDSTVVDPDGGALIPRQEPSGSVPHPEDAVERARKQRSFLATRGIRVPDSLPPVRGAEEAVPHTAREAAERLLGLMSVFEHCLATLSDSDDIGTIAREQPRSFAARTPAEQAAMDSGDVETAQRFSWRSEAAWTLAWALQLAPLTWPDDEIDLGPVTSRVWYKIGEDAFLERAQLLPLPELLDEQERLRGMLWALRDAQIGGREAPPGINPDIVMERADAITWLTSRRQDDWENIAVET